MAAGSWPSISMVCQPNAGDALGVGPGIPAEGGGPALAEAVDVDDAG